ncbi:class F sortase [Psychromicrobium sp. YIM B11713]|uniref:class F sortase n=1 Tax=Psychromicrobium sp. YIM B11713 TaxID=3145233 RepID=UPI00374EC9F8
MNRPRSLRLLGRGTLIGTLAIALAALSVVCWNLLAPAAEPSATATSNISTQRPSASSATASEPSAGPAVPRPSRPDAAAPQPAADQPLRVQLGRLGLDSSILPQSNPAGGRFNPPTVSYTYWMSDYGAPSAQSENTVYLIAHSSGNGYAVFNPLLDLQKHNGAVRKGDEIVVSTAQGSYRYLVSSTTVYDQKTVAQQPELWEKHPGRLVLITCFQYSTTLFSGKNYVVYAQFAGSTEGR